jgi:preprotein translocase subunit SecF
MMFGVVLVGTYTSVFIASPILIYLGVGAGRMGAAEEPEPPAATAAIPAAAKPTSPRPVPATRRARARR